MGKPKLKPHHDEIMAAKADGKSYKEIGDMFDVTPKAVVDYFARVRLHAPIEAIDAATRYIPAKRRCLKCREWFDSEWAGNQICPNCVGRGLESEPDMTYGKAARSRAAMRGRS